MQLAIPADGNFMPQRYKKFGHASVNSLFLYKLECHNNVASHLNIISKLCSILFFVFWLKSHLAFAFIIVITLKLHKYINNTKEIFGILFTAFTDFLNFGSDCTSIFPDFPDFSGFVPDFS